MIKGKRRRPIAGRAASSGFSGLKKIFRRLLGPDGCVWDRKQTHSSIIGHLREETEELIAAVRKKDYENLKEELGDILLHVMFHSELARKKNRFDIDDVIQTLSEKLVRRHPHVFGDASASTPAEVERNWELIKKAEKAARRKKR